MLIMPPYRGRGIGVCDGPERGGAAGGDRHHASVETRRRRRRRQETETETEREAEAERQYKPRAATTGPESSTGRKFSHQIMGFNASNLTAQEARLQSIRVARLTTSRDGAPAMPAKTPTPICHKSNRKNDEPVFGNQVVLSSAKCRKSQEGMRKSIES